MKIVIENKDMEEYLNSIVRQSFKNIKNSSISSSSDFLQEESKYQFKYRYEVCISNCPLVPKHLAKNFEAALNEEGPINSCTVVLRKSKQLGLYATLVYDIQLTIKIERPNALKKYKFISSH